MSLNNSSSSSLRLLRTPVNLDESSHSVYTHALISFVEKSYAENMFVLKIFSQIAFIYAENLSFEECQSQEKSCKILNWQTPGHLSDSIIENTDLRIRQSTNTATCFRY